MSADALVPPPSAAAGETEPAAESETELEVATTAGTRFGLRVLPQADESAPVILLLPAMGVRTKYYTPFAEALRSLGYSVVTTDLRWHHHGAAALRRSAGSRGSYQEGVEDDLPTITAATRERFPGAPLFVVGHSLGGQLSILRAAREAPDSGGLSGLAVIGAGTSYWRVFRPLRSAWVLGGSTFVAGVSQLLGYWPGHRFGFGGRQPRALMLDWARSARTGRYRLARSEPDLLGLLGAVTLPVLAISLDADHLAPRRAVDYFTRRLTGSEVHRVHLDRTSGSTHLGHFDWMKEPAVIARHVAEWIDLVLGRSGTGAR
ncbi:putative alpha/beta hydrolase [Frankia casuarinae]|uniref:Alpha/beta hydrolase fold n=1 Tax=Frankia casuarinae (strain DSM 45818 / CECT 9043 / HFP020203 / CcI3) TaxID=106370 RepID=Q2J8U8_FRACC|nr:MULTISPECIES: alpha/beta fold hydrolase [Frankia]ABD12294.1 alpha/beta hydrolase fold [Frankia casuarinae]ETA01120.1 putative alpha/beta hydrolase [Frankia sp. CcI6]EYT90044.1 putative alpha/beta hydrolase [Frankia casuarinae]KDA42168.1 putative alpha/beta hydrolase [Frankia sp. BMG5.23]KFB03170.1 putative alpha/beta hydrolase [Frankia sp. Allo2]